MTLPDPDHGPDHGPDMGPDHGTKRGTKRGTAPPRLGVVVVTFNAADVILDCVESLLAARDVRLDIVVVDNASTDDTVACLRAWAAGTTAYSAPPDLPFALSAQPKPIALQDHIASSQDAHSTVTLIETGLNGGFAAGVNIGLAHLAACPDIDRFWVLNPDSAVPPETPLHFASDPGPAEGFSLMGGRVIYYDQPDRIQIDGGVVNMRTGVTGNIGLGKPHSLTAPPVAAALGFITGASMVVSRAFYEKAGPMAEDYFLYYEEVDWALRRLTLAGRDLPLAYCAQGVVYHRAGTAIGSPAPGRPASPFSLYFKHRGRIRFIRRFRPHNLPIAFGYSLAKATQLALRGYRLEAVTILRASFGLPPPASVRARLSPAAARHAFGRSR